MVRTITQTSVAGSVRWTLRFLLSALLVAVVFLAGTPLPAEAGFWHAPNGYAWTVDAICEDGVRIVHRVFPSETIEQAESYTMPDTIPFKLYLAASAPRRPHKAFAPLRHGKELGAGAIRLSVHRSPLHWVNDENRTTGVAYLHGKGQIAWSPDQGKTLPLGTPIAIRLQNSGYYFVGQVTACT